MKISNKSFLIYGLSLTGQAVLEFLKTKDVVIYLKDDYKDIEKFIDNKKIFPYSEYLIENKLIDIIIVSPGVLLKNKLFAKAKEKRIKILSEIEFAYRLCKSKNIIAITGTNGKTTVTELVNHIISQKHKAFKCGNIGIPFISQIEKIEKNDFVVLELSSFQLELVGKFRPKISVILNLKPDHLDRYKRVIDYYNAKMNIYKRQKRNDFCILNFDDLMINKLLRHCRAKKYYYSLKEHVNCYYSNGVVQTNLHNKENFTFDAKVITLKGSHNIGNVMAGILVAKILKIANSDIDNALKTFKAPHHRLERVCEKNGVEYINDSKATNIDATINAVNTFKDKRVHLIIGGSDKGENFEILFNNLNENVFCYIYGETRNKMIACAKNVEYTKYKTYNILGDVLRDVDNYTKSNDIVLLSPACASFDEFSSYEERGDFFVKWVRNNEKI